VLWVSRYFFWEITWKNNIFSVSGFGLGSDYVLAFENQSDLGVCGSEFACGSEESSDVFLFGLECAINSSRA
jgi:hypothetical protein